MNVVILVPRRIDNGERDGLWNFAREWWERDFPDWPIFEGFDNSDQPFNRAAAVNQAAALAGEWDVAHIIDSDVLADPKGVRQAVDLAAQTGMAVVAHNERLMLSKTGTQRVMGGYRGPWTEKGMVIKSWFDSVSCSIAVPRVLWARTGGLDERFVGWGFEDTAGIIAMETLTDQLLMRVNSQCWHLFHSSNPDARIKSPTFQANLALVERYRAARFDPVAMQALLDERFTPTAPSELGPTVIPRVLHRTVPAETSEQIEGWWGHVQTLHPGWDARTYREPLDPKDWPLTSDLWPRCSTGAQKAGLVRLECLVRDGGWYLDSDIEPVRSLEPFSNCSVVAAWEDERCVPDAVLGAAPNHPAIRMCLEKARSVIEGGGDPWHSGPGVTTEVLPGRPDVLVLPPGAFYEVHYLEKSRLNEPHPPWAFLRHHWHGSWLTPAQRRSQERRQRR